MFTAQIINSDERNRAESFKKFESKKKKIIVSVLSVMLLTGGTWSVAAEKADPNKPPMTMHGKEGMSMGKDMGAWKA